MEGEKVPVPKGLRVEVAHDEPVVKAVRVPDAAEGVDVGETEGELVEDGQVVVVGDSEGTVLPLRVPLLDAHPLHQDDRDCVGHSEEVTEGVGHALGEPVGLGVTLAEGVWVGLALSEPRVWVP